MMGVPRSTKGATLVELLVSIVIVATAASAVLGVLSINVAGSVDPMHQHQAVAVAQAYLEEVLLRPFDDPDGVDTETVRAEFDDVDDYDGHSDSGATNQFGLPIAGLDAYDVDVYVSATAALPGVPAGDALRVDVRVRRDAAIDIVLSGYRLRY